MFFSFCGNGPEPSGVSTYFCFVKLKMMHLLFFAAVLGETGFQSQKVKRHVEIQKTKKLINPVLFLLFASTSATSEPRPGGGSKLRNGETSKSENPFYIRCLIFKILGLGGPGAF